MRKLATAVAALALLSACDSTSGGIDKQTAGAVLGGIGGAVIGSQFGEGSGQIAATAAGTLLGAYLGSEIGKSLDAADRAMMDQATQQATTAPVGQTIDWSNTNSGNSGTVTATRQGRGPSGESCREFLTTVEVDGRLEEQTSIACQQPDGSWQVVSG